jgi:hypothetical protein
MIAVKSAPLHGVVAQLGERRVRNAKVGSSILLHSSRTTYDDPETGLKQGRFHSAHSSAHVIQAAQEELSALGVNGTVIDVRREYRSAVIVLDDGPEITATSWTAVKLLKMLRANLPRGPG